MVIAKKGCVLHPGIKESMPSVQVPKRFVENPRCYRPRSTSVVRLSPLRIRKAGNYGHERDLNLNTIASNKSARRVRFALPTPNNTNTNNTINRVGVSSIRMVPQQPPQSQPQRMLPTAARRFSTTVIGASTSHSRSSRRPGIITTSELETTRRPIAVVVPARRPHCYAAPGERDNPVNVKVAVAASPGVRARVHPTGRYARGTLSPTASAAPVMGAPPVGKALLQAAADGDDDLLRDLLRRSSIISISESELNATDRSGRTILSHLASNGPADVLERILLLPGLRPNQPDNEGNTPLHFAAQAGQTECLNCMLTRCKTIEVDARNNTGFTPLMKAALQGRYKCAKMLLFAGANPTLKDDGRALRADQWARFCGRYVCADVIEKHARQKLLERTTSYGNWGTAADRTPTACKVPITTTIVQHSTGIRSKLKKVFRTSSSGAAAAAAAEANSVRLVTQLTTAALCASTPVLPAAPSVPPVVKSLIRPLTVPRLQITLANGDGNGDYYATPVVTQTTTSTTVRTKKKSK
ncbi:cortactin-binding protein 2-like isoform X2 [Atheta coriaria]|uniref:cortactin-binding protein 2-like isoform X2 n=1 Tax=Dalotia coriaria TaxID=877792 RepID=UPI0031F38293